MGIISNTGGFISGFKKGITEKKLREPKKRKKRKKKKAEEEIIW